MIEQPSNQHIIFNIYVFSITMNTFANVHILRLDGIESNTNFQLLRSFFRFDFWIAIQWNVLSIVYHVSIKSVKRYRDIIFSLNL